MWTLSGNPTIAGNTTISGNVGIGIASSSWRLNVADGTFSVGAYANTSYFGATSGFQNNTTASYNNACFYCSGSAVFGRWVAAVSDTRIKKEIEDINDDTALLKILAIEPKTYKYIDDKRRGDGKVYGFIAQQIKEVIPEAVQFNKDFIPNIYKVFSVSGDIINTNEDLTAILSVNDNIQIIDKEKEEKLSYKILEISPDHIKIDKSINGDECFIYGKEVDDFHTISKEYIFTLNVCATQELHRIIQKQQQEIDELKTTLSNVLERLNNLISS